MTASGRRERRLVLGVEVALPIAYAVVTLVFSAPLRRFEAEPDEGVNLAKAALRADGHALYDEVWSDQPPLFTATLRALFAVVGEGVTAARLLVLAFACALLWACARIARRAWGTGEALVACLLLLLAPPFQRLSVAVMIGLPAVAFAALALACAPPGRAPWGPARAAASGALLALGALTKLFVLPLAPILLAGVALRAPRGARARAALAGAGGFVVTAAIGFLALASPAALTQLVAPHAAAATEASYRGEPAFGLLRVARPLWWLAALAVAGVVLARPWRRPIAREVLAWALASGALLSIHRPVWPHHLLLLTLPAAVLGGAGAMALARALAARAPRGLERAVVRRGLAALAALAVAWPLADAGRWRWPRGPGASFRREQALADGLRSLARPGDVVLTDRPMHAFRAGVPVLPETAVFTEKRQRTGHLTEARLLEVVARDHPALVHLGRFRLPAARAALRATYGAPFRLGDQEIFRRERGDPSDLEAWPPRFDRPDGWYGEARALRIAEHILAAQHADGGWGKNEDRRLGWVRAQDQPPCHADRVGACSTIDNGATTTEMRFLARVRAATGDPRAAAAYVRALDHLLRAQTATGGWPQVPAARAGSYPAAITLNDDAMALVMEVLREAADSPLGDFLDAARRERARAAFHRGVDCLLRAQVRVGGRRTVWCAQHDPVTLAPVPARSYEPASLSGQESVGAVRVLMGVERPSPEVVEAVEAAVAWFRRTPLPADDGAPRRWARFYDLETSTPIWPDRDGTRRASPDLLSEERRLGYDYVTDAPRALLETDHPRWRERLDRAR